MMHYVYKIVNTITNEYYIGAHTNKSKTIDDYMGSGLLISKAIKYYGASNFQKIIIKQCKSYRDQFAQERKILTKEVVSDPMCYNLKSGGKRRSKNSFLIDKRTKACYKLFYVKPSG